MIELINLGRGKAPLKICVKVISTDFLNQETSKFCDCKYGGKHVGVYGHEDNGCPEMREAVAIIGALTDKEFDRISNRLVKRFSTKKKV